MLSVNHLITTLRMHILINSEPCPRCGRDMIIIPELKICAECADDQIELDTGCRFGTPEKCIGFHGDCKQTN